MIEEINELKYMKKDVKNKRKRNGELLGRSILFS